MSELSTSSIQMKMTKKELFLSIKKKKVFKSRERLIHQYFERVNRDTPKGLQHHEQHFYTPFIEINYVDKITNRINVDCSDSPFCKVRLSSADCCSLVRPRLGHARLGAHQELELAHDMIRCYDHDDQDHWSSEELISQRQKA